MITRWKLLCAATVVAASAVSAFAQAPFPTRPIRIVVNASPGANLDVTTRLVAQKMSESLGQPVIVENKAGADGLIGIQYVKSAPADGYTILASSNTIAYASAFKVDPGFNLEKDFAGIGSVIKLPLAMVGTVNQPARNLQEFIAQAKANPSQMSYASGGLGTTTFLAAAMLLKQAGIQILHVPYKGTGAAAPDVLAGRVNMIFDGLSTVATHVRDGKLRAFGVTSPTRLAAFPDIPTIAEQGLPSFSYYLYTGLVAPAGTPKEVINRLNEALRVTLANESVRETFARQGSEIWSTSPDEFNRILKQDSEQSVKLVTEMGITKQ